MLEPVGLPAEVAVHLHLAAGHGGAGLVGAERPQHVGDPFPRAGAGEGQRASVEHLGLLVVEQAPEHGFDRLGRQFLPAEGLEQGLDPVPAVRIAVAGMMIQQLPGAGGDPDGWNRIEALFETLGGDELAAEPVETVLWRLFHDEDATVLDRRPLAFACSCSRERVADMLRSLGPDEARAAMAGGQVEVHCDFCGQAYRFEHEEVEDLFRLGALGPGTETNQ